MGGAARDGVPQTCRDDFAQVTCTIMRIIGRGLQILALMLLPLAVILEVSDVLGRPFGVADMLLMLLYGVVAFLLGRMLEGYATS